MAFTYAIVDSFAIVFLLILLVSTREKSSQLTDTRCFRSIVVMTMIALASDMLSWQFEGRAGGLCRALLWAANISCYLLSGAMTLNWLYYTGLKLNRLTRISKLGWALIALPFFFLAALALSAPWTHWLFYLDAGNCYRRGPLFAVQIVIPMGYIVAAALWALHRAGLERLRQLRMEYLSLSAFIIFPLIGGILQILFYGVSLAWPCSALSLMLVYVNLQNHKISLDALTGLNNRGQFDKYLYGCVEHADSDHRFALFMLDIDEFKKINDAFGHTAGDAALIDAAALLTSALADANAFLSRYGGDEFAIVLHYARAAQVDELLAKIDEASQRHNQESNAPYKLVFSAGYVCYDKQRYTNYQDMITAADAHMYMQKRQHKALRR